MEVLPFAVKEKHNHHFYVQWPDQEGMEASNKNLVKTLPNGKLMRVVLKLWMVGNNRVRTITTQIRKTHTTTGMHSTWKSRTSSYSTSLYNSYMEVSTSQEVGMIV